MLLRGALPSPLRFHALRSSLMDSICSRAAENPVMVVSAPPAATTAPASLVSARPISMTESGTGVNESGFFFLMDRSPMSGMASHASAGTEASCRFRSANWSAMRVSERRDTRDASASAFARRFAVLASISSSTCA